LEQAEMTADFALPSGKTVSPDLIRRVGFLRRGQPFDAGDVEERVFERLCELTQNPWQPWGMLRGSSL
jgi:hypothetical protein